MDLTYLVASIRTSDPEEVTALCENASVQFPLLLSTTNRDI